MRSTTKITYIALLSILMGSTSTAQIDSTLKDFFPLQIGNYWEYSMMWDQGSGSHWSESVVGDTVMPNGKRYFIMLRRDIPRNSSTDSYTFYRFNDSLQVMKFSASIEWCTEMEAVEFDFKVPERTYWPICYPPNSGFNFMGVFGSGTQFNYFLQDSARVRLYCNVTVNPQTKQALFDGPVVTRITKGIGISDFSFEASGSAYLVGAVINGRKYGYITAIENSPGKNTPESYTLFQNFPNPFNPSTTIAFYLPKASFITLKATDILGREVMILAQETFTAGEHNIKFNGDNLPSGVYLYRLTANNYTMTKKMLLVR